ncbi:MAG: hypothetical protein AAF530_24515 [Pseudomonadota bacterium]
MGERPSLGILFSALALALGACVTTVQDQLEAKSYAPMTAEEITELVAGKTLFVEDQPFIFYETGGRTWVNWKYSLELETPDDTETPFGTWHARSPNLLCQSGPDRARGESCSAYFRSGPKIASVLQGKARHFEVLDYKEGNLIPSDSLAN